MPLPLKIVHDSDPIIPQKPPASASSLAHKDLRRGAFWQAIPAYKSVDEATFLDHAWQAKSSITRVAKLSRACSRKWRDHGQKPSLRTSTMRSPGSTS